MGKILFRHEADFSYDTPQDMYRDYKQKKIKGLLDYQSEILNKYIEKSKQGKIDFSLELPTGSGKTLVGLLICEYRRRKFHERTVFVCLNKQLVNQVVKEAKTKYQIPVVAFSGKFDDYSISDLTEFQDSSAIAVVDYSAIFNRFSKITQVGTFIFDDAHNVSNYIDANWTVEINRQPDQSTFEDIVDVLRIVLDDTSLAHLTKKATEDPEWCNMLSWPAFDQVKGPLLQTLSKVLKDRAADDPSNYYAWQNIQDHLFACQVFFSEDKILIKPAIAPTQEIKSFSGAKQRIYMSATSGRSGELQRAFGVRTIDQISINERHVPSIGRRFFVFPDVKFSSENKSERLFKTLRNVFGRALVLVPSNNASTSIEQNITEDNPLIKVYRGRDLQGTMDSFVKDANGVAVLANRYDGIDFPDDACHLLLLKDLQRYQDLQDRFFTTRLKASPLLAETLKNRITQAVGRCTRSTTDFAVVIIEGQDLQSALNSKDKLQLFSPELRAEIETGYSVSKTYSRTFVELTEFAQSILQPSQEEWQSIDQEIIHQRDVFQNESDVLPEMYRELRLTAQFEVQAQDYIWNGNNRDAIDVIEKIITNLKEPSLRGLVQYWQYLQGAMYYRLNEDPTCRKSAINIFQALRKNTDNLTWFQSLDRYAHPNLSADTLQNQERVARMVDRIEEKIESETISMDSEARLTYFTTCRNNLLNKLNSSVSGAFEDPLTELGEFIGIKSENSSKSGAPDPWWTLDDNTVIVTEAKIYDNCKKLIPLKHVR
ncbi:DEAD/DEAH box helicase family protein [Lacticaseibacillus chiayiensis]|uniref:DEAD/DEAH box helicase family protein n=1 Tax=Lacticaseibacillus chiayiensis TaxID=2100821 RepID=UPI001010A3DB|nr:DEAD/DEAH box helicase family protein [Lacticaseibacillus chiayiensis]RXT55652.1 hypothetical protein CHT97_12265 [Lacticaseibacillus chiayiensis]